MGRRARCGSGCLRAQQGAVTDRQRLWNNHPGELYAMIAQEGRLHWSDASPMTFAERFGDADDVQCDAGRESVPTVVSTKTLSIFR
jgi:hypothetical protein